MVGLNEDLMIEVREHGETSLKTETCKMKRERADELQLDTLPCSYSIMVVILVL